jgi:hypothetical protein
MQYSGDLVGVCCTVLSSINAMMCSSPKYSRKKEEMQYSDAHKNKTYETT